MEGQINVKIEVNGSAGVKEALEQINSTLNKLESNVEKLDKQSQKLLGNVKSISVELNKSFAQLNEQITSIDLAAPFTEGIRNIYSEVEELVNSLNSLKLDNPLEEEIERFSAAFSEFSDEYLKMISAVENFDSGRILARFAEGIQAIMSEIDQFDGHSDKLLENIKKISAGLDDSLKSFLSIISTEVPESTAKFGNEMEKNLKNTFNNIFNSFTSGFTGTINSISDVLRNALSATGIEEFAENIGGHWEKLLEWFGNGVAEFEKLGNAIDRISEAGEKIYEVVQKIISIPSDVITKLFNINFEGVLNGVGKILPFVNNFRKTAEKQIEGVKDQWNAVSDLLEDSVTGQIQMIQDRYARILSGVTLPPPSQLLGQTDEEFALIMEKYRLYMLELAGFQLDLEKQQADDIESVRDTSVERQKIVLRTLYNDDLNRYLENERKKLAVEIETLEGIKQERIEAEEDYSDIEAQLVEKRHLDNIYALNQELLIAGDNAKAKYEAKKEYLEKELELHEGNAERLKEINAELAENEREYHQEKIAALEELTERTMEGFTGLDEALRLLDEAKMQRLEANNEEEKEKLSEKLEQGLISQEEYDEQMLALEENLDAEKAKIARKQAVREKAMKVYEIAMNTAAAVMKIWGEVPKFDFGVSTGILSGIAIATGAAQTAAVLAAPLPKASLGMLLRGKSHAQGGIPIEAEGGEAIINKRSTAMFAPLLSAINVAGGGVPFAAPLSDGGYFQRTAVSSTNPTAKELTNAFSAAIREIKIYTAIDDVRRADKYYTTITQTRPSY